MPTAACVSCQQCGQVARPHGLHTRACRAAQALPQLLLLQQRSCAARPHAGQVRRNLGKGGGTRLHGWDVQQEGQEGE